MKFYKIALFKASFEKGYSLLSYPKWIIGIFGIGAVVEKNYLAIAIGALAFFIFSTLLGWVLIRCGFYEAENEVGNQYNLLAKQIRNKLIDKPNKRKSI